MKSVIAFLLTLSVAAAFAPAPAGRASTQVQQSFWDTVFGMDLFEPVKTQNDYGARSGKNLKVGKVSKGSYVPAGLTLAEYEKIRASDAKKASDNYARNVKKAFQFEGFDEFYKKRGTDLSQGWIKSEGRGHRFAKTKYDYSGSQDDTKGWGDAIGNIFKK